MNRGSRPRAAAASGRLRERLRAETRDTILLAAERALGEHGARGAKMEHIASAAGIAVGTLYNYFADRQELIDALFELRRSELIARLDAALEAVSSQPFERSLEAFFGAGLAHFEEHRAFVALVAGEELSSPHSSRASMLEALRARASRLIQAGLDASLLRAEDRDTYPHVLIGLLKGLVEVALVAQPLAPAPERVASAVRCFLRGALVQP